MVTCCNRGDDSWVWPGKFRKTLEISGWFSWCNLLLPGKNQTTEFLSKVPKQSHIGIGNQPACADKPRTRADGLYSYLVHLVGLYKWHPRGRYIYIYIWRATWSIPHVATWRVFFCLWTDAMGWAVHSDAVYRHVSFVVRPWSRACIIRTWDQFLCIIKPIMASRHVTHVVFDTKNESTFTKQVPRNAQLCLMNRRDHQNCDPWYPYVYQDVDGFWRTSLKLMMSKTYWESLNFGSHLNAC